MPTYEHAIRQLLRLHKRQEHSRCGPLLQSKRSVLGCNVSSSTKGSGPPGRQEPSSLPIRKNCMICCYLTERTDKVSIKHKSLSLVLLGNQNPLVEYTTTMTQATKARKMQVPAPMI